MRQEELFYDFERDAWIEVPGIHACWNERELAPAIAAPAPGAWTGPRPVGRWRLPRVAMVMMVLTGSILAIQYGLLYLVPALGLSQGIYGIATAGLPRPTSNDLMLYENPDDLDLCLVEASFLKNGRTTGRDRGVVWFSEGRLLFCGHRTSFALGGEDVLPPARRTKTERERGDLLTLRGLPFRANIVFRPVMARGESPARAHRFLERLYAFQMRPPVSRGPRQWPPFEP